MDILGVKIITNHLMVENGDPYKVIRTWKERLFSCPWRPFKKTRTIIPKVPMRSVMKLPNGTYVMHPAMLNELKRQLKPNKLAYEINKGEA